MIRHIYDAKKYHYKGGKLESRKPRNRETDEEGYTHYYIEIMLPELVKCLLIEKQEFCTDLKEIEVDNTQDLFYKNELINTFYNLPEKNYIREINSLEICEIIVYDFNKEYHPDEQDFIVYCYGIWDEKQEHFRNIVEVKLGAYNETENKFYVDTDKKSKIYEYTHKGNFPTNNSQVISGIGGFYSFQKRTTEVVYNEKGRIQGTRTVYVNYKFKEDEIPIEEYVNTKKIHTLSV